jgi:hypothetical protein
MELANSKGLRVGFFEAYIMGLVVDRVAKAILWVNNNSRCVENSV